MLKVALHEPQTSHWTSYLTRDRHVPVTHAALAKCHPLVRTDATGRNRRTAKRRQERAPRSIAGDAFTDLTSQYGNLWLRFEMGEVEFHFPLEIVVAEISPYSSPKLSFWCFRILVIHGYISRFGVNGFVLQYIAIISFFGVQKRLCYL
ncbi:hypothetical protein V6N12_059192 [Hibiscus sabdariffa]|uniref:Uncharacterized protein n=1 Tax=Hibiscus sabdariffa TaxID=183260 RepID=A0ABR2EX80_9ROSI